MVCFLFNSFYLNYTDNIGESIYSCRVDIKLKVSFSFHLVENTIINPYFLSSKPLTFVNEKQQKKEAVAAFKLVQIYMSDRKAKVGMTINGVAHEIVEAGYANICLRDEIYIQLCKQVRLQKSDFWLDLTSHLLLSRSVTTHDERASSEAGNCWPYVWDFSHLPKHSSPTCWGSYRNTTTPTWTSLRSVAGHFTFR